MSLIGYFLTKEDQSPSNIKYLHSLLSLPVSRLVKEKEVLTERSQALESQIHSQALSESKEFILALGNTQDLLKLNTGILNSFEKSKQAALRFKEEVYNQTALIENILFSI